MKKILLIVFSVFLSIVASAQKIHFTDNSNHWFIYHTGDGTLFSSWYYSTLFAGDTVINSNLYKRIPSQGTGFASCNGCTVSFIREDTILNKVFVLINDTEQVLMDYNLNVGDTVLHTNSLHNTTKYTVSSIDSTIINSIYHKVWKFNLVYPTTYSYLTYYSVIEGIGCTNGPLYLIWPNSFESVDNLICFYNNGTNPLVSPSVLESGVSIYFDNHTSCTVGINAVSKTALGYTLSPNPATTSLTIASTNKITNITITNLLGLTVYTHEYNAEQVQVSVADLPTGLYFVKINDSEVRKFLKL